jgi:3-oxoacyl-(acyl-carrier-protein) synthase
MSDARPYMIQSANSYQQSVVVRRGGPMIGRCDVGAVARGWSGLTEHRGCSLGEVGVLRYRSCRRLVVIATHLDEDISAAGGLIARLAEQDVPIDVLAVTDGDGATVGAKGATPPHELGRRRAHRSVSYRRLGAYQVRRHELALRSNTIADAEADVVAALSEILGFDPDPCAVGARSLAARRTRGSRRSRTSRRGRLSRLPRPAGGVSGDELELRGPARRPVGACTAAAAHSAAAPAQAACDLRDRPAG